MAKVTRMSEGRGCAQAHHGGEILPFVYQRLWRLAAQDLAHECGGQPIEPGDLVHEAWLRITHPDDHLWNSTAHFFTAAATAMRRILVENARRRKTLRHSGEYDWLPLEGTDVPVPTPEDDLLALDEALTELALVDPLASNLIELRFFAGLTQDAAAHHLGICRSSADRTWLFARAWLFARLRLLDRSELPPRPRANYAA
jgi:RNA polymerase sigma factor (TIGR02999 family)